EEIKPKLPENLFTPSQLEYISRKNDVAIIFITRISGEGYDRKAEKGDYYLSDDEFELIKTVSGAFHGSGKKVVVVLNIGSPIEIESWKEMCDAIVLVWQPGQEAGRILADIITGKVNPSGKLPTTFPKDYTDVPSRSFPGEPLDNPVIVTYDEGIYVGYRYYDTFRIKPSFEFGFGLSYTKFEYSKLRLYKDGSSIAVRFDIKNVGNKPGKEVAQLYVRAPKSLIDKPYQELKGFHKTRLLNPEEVETVEIILPISELASFDGNKWIVEEGEYEFIIGASSRDVRLKGCLKL
ncbi:MAG: glycoside hydrolase family 3 C-terminal domain-containing protein, partial [Fervidobacterium sp.]